MKTGESKRMKPASDHQLDAAPAQQIDYRLIVGFTARIRLVVQDFGGDAVILRPHQTESVGFVAQNQFDLSVEFFSLNGVDDRLQIGTAAGKQNAMGTCLAILF